MRLCVIALLANVAAGITVSIEYPQSLQKRYSSGVPARFAGFGKMPYGSYVAGRVMKVSSDCCVSCSPPDFKPAIPSVFLILSENCSFGTMVRYAEAEGAKAVLIYNRDQRQGTDLMDAADNTTVSVPSALIDSHTARDILIAYGEVVVNMTFESASRTPTVEVGVVYALENTLDVQIVALLPTILEYWPNAVMKVYFSLYSYPVNFTQDTSLDCLCGNKYCSTQHQQGHFVVQESIRQHCVLSLANNIFSRYVAYMTAWAQYCSFEPKKECTEGYEAAGVTPEEVQQCYSDSFGGDENSNCNTILEAAQSDFEALQLNFTPAIIVGGEIMHGDLSSANLKRMICAHLDADLTMCTDYYCAPGCWQDMLSNLLCDPACNVEACGFDQGRCTTPDALFGVTHLPGGCGTRSECSPGCYNVKFHEGVCSPVCNNSLCSDQDWMCACAYGCFPTMLQNDFCDPECNNYLCDFDKGACSSNTYNETDPNPPLNPPLNANRSFVNHRWDISVVLL